MRREVASLEFLTLSVFVSNGLNGRCGLIQLGKMKRIIDETA